MKKFKRVSCVILSALLAVSTFTGCGNETVQNQEGTVIRVGSTPAKGTQEYETFMENQEAFLALYPDVQIQNDSWAYTIDTFLPKAASGKLPCYWEAMLTEVRTFTEGNYAADITEQMKKRGMLEGFTEHALSFMKVGEQYYGIPKNLYCLGLVLNKNLFKQAGLVDKDGYVIVPQTYDELAQMASEIKKKTGQAGFVMPTMSNNGGWLFTNIAWAFGTEFLSKDENGKWIAAFASPECEAALQWVKDLKWKYDAVSENAYIDGEEMRKMYASDQAGIALLAPNEGAFNQFVVKYGMDKDAIAACNVPEGPAGRIGLVGGAFYVFDKNLDENQLEAAFNLAEYNGAGTVATEDKIRSLTQTYEKYSKDGSPIGPAGYELYTEGGVADTLNELREKYVNVDMKNFESYNVSEVIPHVEVEICAQELYSILDGCIQEVLVNKDSDVKQLLKDAANDYQVNYLDNID